MDINKFPKEKHYAVIVFNGDAKHDGAGWYCGANAVDYFVKTHEELLTWIVNHSKNKQYKVVEVYPMEVVIPAPIIKGGREDV